MRISDWSSDVCSSDLWLSPAALHDCGRRACFSGRRAARRRRPAADHGRRDVMRVGMLGSISWRTPPRGYGPWELVTSLLTEALVARGLRSEEHTSELQSLMRISYAVFCLKTKKSISINITLQPAACRQSILDDKTTLV